MTTTVLSSKTLDTAKAKALEAKKAYFLPKMIDSAGMALCWEGRIMRGMELAEQAMQDKATERLERMRQGLERVRADMDAARYVMDNAIFDYINLCERANVAPESLEVGQCDCFYCEKSRAGDALWVAESRLRAAVFGLTEPDQDHNGVPLPLAYLNMGETGKQKTWDLIIELCNAQANYQRACEQMKKVPAWGYVLRAW